MSSPRVRTSICSVAVGFFLLLLVAHGIHDAAHEHEAGAIVCVALTLGLIPVRRAPSTLAEISAVVPILLPPVVLRSPAPIERRPRGSPTARSSPLRL